MPSPIPSQNIVVSESSQISSTFAGLIGPVLLALGVFLPALTIQNVEKNIFGKDPTYWSIAMYETHDSEAYAGWELYAILGLAAGSLVLVGLRLPALLVLTGLGSLGVIALSLMSLRATVVQFYPQQFAKNQYQLQMGWVFMIAGALWIFAAGTASIKLGSRRRV